MQFCLFYCCCRDSVKTTIASHIETEHLFLRIQPFNCINQFFLTAEKLFGGNVNKDMNGSEAFMIELMEARVHTVTKNYLLLVNLILVHYIPI